MIDELRAASYQRLARADDGQVSLGVLAAVFEWVKNFGIHSSQADQALGVYLIGLTPAGVDEPRPARVGYQDLGA